MHTKPTFAGISLLIFTGCGAAGGSAFEEVEASAEAFGESACLTAASDATLVSRAGPIHSPTSYDNPGCRKSFIYRLSGAFTSGARAQVRWTDPWSRNEAQCRNAALKFQVMSRRTTPPIPAFYGSDGTFSFPLYWDAPSQSCWYPYVEITQQQGSPATAFAEYAPARGTSPSGPVPPIPNNLTHIDLSGSLIGESVRIAAQALTPAGSTQSVSADFAAL